MKKLEEIKNEVAEEIFGCPFHQIEDGLDTGEAERITTEIAKRYAQSCCEDLRERIAKEATTACDCDVWNCEGESVDKESIRNTEIILP